MISPTVATHHAAACDICGGHDRTKLFGAWLVGQDTKMCFPCFTVWYDEGQTNAADIRARSLRNQERKDESFDPSI